MTEQPALKNEEKRPYEKPAIVYSQPMEGIAGACSDEDPINGKADQAQCATLNS
ncbi:MAG: hypothetical protein AB1791_17320 [Chloroflexota bacterium]